MRVLHVLDTLQPSGAETSLAVAARRLADLGITCDVIATGDLLGPYAPALRDAGYRTGWLPFDPVPRFASRFWRLLRSESYDVVHSHVERGNFVIDLLARAAGVGVVQHLHGVYEFDGGLRLERTIQRRIMAAAGVRFVGVSEDVRRNEATRFGIRAEVILNWVDVDRFRPPTAAERAAARTRQDLHDDAFVLCTVGNCNEIKNHAALIDAMSRLPDEVVWLHIGTGGEEAAEMAAAAAAGVIDRIRFLGQQAPITHLHAADAFVMPSLHEGQGIAAIEALCTDLPGVLADVPGLRTLRQFDVPVVWTTPDAEGLAAAVRSLLGSDRRPDGDAVGLRRTFSVERAVPQLAGLYASLAPGGAP